MSPMKKLILYSLLVFGTISCLVLATILRHSEQSAPTDQDISQSVRNSIAKLEALFAKYIKDDLKPEQNALFSPLDIYTVLSLLNMGTNEETSDELLTEMRILPADESGLSAAHRYLGKILNGLQTSDTAEVKIANAVFVQKGFKLEASYLQAWKNYYKSEAQQADFAKGGSEATDLVNNWISNNTKNHIPQLFKNQISPSTSLFLVSALFFNATWQYPFKKSETKNEIFNTGVKQVDVPLMHQKGYVPYFKSDVLGIEAISVPYEKKRIQHVDHFTIPE